MNASRMVTLLRARNREFYRDKGAFGWNFLFPFLIILGFGIIFGGKEFAEYKVGVFPADGKGAAAEKTLPERFRESRYVQFVGFPSKGEGLARLRVHKIDLLVEAGGENRYWVSDTSPKGYVIERIFRESLVPEELRPPMERNGMAGVEIRYIDWLFPGILGMNMMFSALWGVGYVVVRYRKNGVLKRLKATPLTAFEYLTAQMLSRLLVLMFTFVIMWFGCDLIFSFNSAGSFLDVFIMFFLGGTALTSLGLLVAARGTSEEFTSGLLNFITWPMMFLSEVWFSLEGAPEWVRLGSRILPLSHVLSGVRRIMADGAGLADLVPEITFLSLATLVFLAVGARLFSWTR